ncbi:MAG: hypothetical protein ACRD01_14000 [Terriglobales bacterium]
MDRWNFEDPVMNKTTENLLTYAPLGAGLALLLSDHKRLGVAVMSVSPITVATQHPRATWRSLRALPKSMRVSGKATGKALRRVSKSVERSGREAGKAIRWMAV